MVMMMMMNVKLEGEYQIDPVTRSDAPGTTPMIGGKLFIPCARI